MKQKILRVCVTINIKDLRVRVSLKNIYSLASEFHVTNDRQMGSDW